jgi:hypothetical protein
MASQSMATPLDGASVPTVLEVVPDYQSQTDDQGQMDKWADDVLENEPDHPEQNKDNAKEVQPFHFSISFPDTYLFLESHLTTRSGDSAYSQRKCQQQKSGQGEEDAKQPFGNRRGTTCNAGKPHRPGDQ